MERRGVGGGGGGGGGGGRLGGGGAEVVNGMGKYHFVAIY